MKEKAALEIQRYGRGLIARQLNKGIREKAKNARILFVKNRAAVTIQRYYRGFAVRKRIAHFKASVRFI